VFSKKVGSVQALSIYLPLYALISKRFFLQEEAKNFYFQGNSGGGSAPCQGSKQSKIFWFFLEKRKPSLLTSYLYRMQSQPVKFVKETI
jgi:hypothetical protein